MRKQCGKVIEWLWVRVPPGQPYTLLVQWIEWGVSTAMMWVQFLQRVPGGMAELGLLQRSWKPSIAKAVPGFESQSLRQASEMMALCGIAGIGRQHWLRISGRKTLGFEPLIPHHYARLTQLGECYLYKVEAVGSSPTPSTKYQRMNFRATTR